MKVFFTHKMVAQAGEDSPSPRKPALVVAAWKQAGIPLDIEAPYPVTVDDFALAHDRQHVEDILALKKPNGFGNHDQEVAASLPFTSGTSPFWRDCRKSSPGSRIARSFCIRLALILIWMMPMAAISLPSSLPGV